MSASHINKNHFQNEVLDSEKPVLLDFWASWCGPCRMVSPIVDEIAAERSDIKVGKTTGLLNDQDTPVFVYCHSGARSAQAASALRRMGYTNVKNIGGIAAYTGKVEH